MNRSAPEVLISGCIGEQGVGSTMLEQKRSESMSSSADKESVSGSGDLSTACQKYGNSESTDSPTRQSAYSSSSDNEEDLIGWKDSAESWMEKWWNERPCNRTGKYHNRFVGHRKRGIVKYVNPGKSVDPSEKFKQSVFCQNVSLAEFTSSVREHNRIYTAVLNAPTGIGLNLTLTESGEVLVQGLNCLKSGLPSPAQMSGLIKVGDRLIGVNNSNFVDATHEEIVSILRGLDSLAKVSCLC